MLSFLYKLQRKPERVRRKIAFVASAVITGIIVIIWLTSLGATVDAPPVVVAKESDGNGPLRAFAENVSTFFSDASEIAQAALGAFSSSSLDAPNQAAEPGIPPTFGTKEGSTEGGAN